jgi:transcription antitermination factor NusG
MTLVPGPGAAAERPWSVLHVVANHEKSVARHLAMRSVEHYLPLYRERSQWTDRRVTLERPLFTGYVFVRFAPQARILVISTPSVLRLLGNSESEMVSAAEIERIRRGLANGCALRPCTDVDVGTRVRVLCGIFSGVEGIVTRFCKQCRVVMTLQATGQRFSLEIDLDDVRICRKCVCLEKIDRSKHLCSTRV